MEEIPIREDCKDLEPFLIGEGEHHHFYINQNAVYCLRATCEGCSLQEDCEFVEDTLEANPLPHPRRGIGMEDTSFLVLVPTGDVDETLQFCEDALGIPEARLAWDEGNVHFFLQEPEPTGGLYIFKGQFRFYGSREEFEVKPWAVMFDVVDSFEPSHRPLSMDFASIEPRVLTLICKEPNWVKAFKGQVKAIYREVEISGFCYPEYVEDIQGKTWCWLKDEIDKINYEDQCRECPIQNHCTVKQDYFKSVSTDWHGENTDGLYPGVFRKAEQEGDKKTYKALRGIGKIVGLALTYGGSAYTVARNMGCSVEDAQVRINSFFQKLNVVQQYMDRVKRDVLKEGYVTNIFGRKRDMTRWTYPNLPSYAKDKMVWKDRGFAQRTALNGPVQGSASEILKISQIYADEYIQEKGLSPFFGLSLPQKIELCDQFYKKIALAQISSVHDEAVFLSLDSERDNVIPALYNIMQLKKITDYYGLGVLFELDVEFDETRSWLSTQSLKTAKIYLLNRLQGNVQEEVKQMAVCVVYEDIRDNEHWREWFSRMVEMNQKEEYKPAGKTGPVIMKFSDRAPVEFQYELAEEDIRAAGVPYTVEPLC